MEIMEHEKRVREAMKGVRLRYRAMHGHMPPRDFLKDFRFSAEMDTPGHVFIRRLERLGDPRVAEHHAILSGAIKKGGIIIDAGCGAGDDSRWLQKNGYGSVTGIDMDTEALRLGRAFYQDAGAAYPKFLVADLCSLPMIDTESVSNVWSSSVIHAFNPPSGLAKFVGECHRILKTGGGFFGRTWGAESDSRLVDSPPVQMKEKEIRSLIEGGDKFRLTYYHVEHVAPGNPRFQVFFRAKKI
jgi:SAM-dependent methyltransferase